MLLFQRNAAQVQSFDFSEDTHGVLLHVLDNLLQVLLFLAQLHLFSFHVDYHFVSILNSFDEI